MYFLLLAVLCSVAVSVFLKLARKNGILIEQAIFINYLVAVALTWFFLNPTLTSIDSYTQSTPVLVALIALGILLPVVFLMMSRAVNTVGIVKSDAAQRLSLVIPMLAAFVLFNEVLTQDRLLGIGLAFAALLCLVYKNTGSRQSVSTMHTIIALLGVWVGYGVIDVLLKQVAKSGNTVPSNLLVSFGLAAVLMLAYLLVKRAQWSGKSLISGILLGVLNFMNIYFYIKAHQMLKDNPSQVFAGMNMGVITLGTLTGWLVFKEKISKINVLGIALALCAILVLFYGKQLFAL